MMRKPLPYEHALIRELGITEEEYFLFRKAQREYRDPKVGTALDIRNEPIATIALVLSIVGTIAQVAAALLAPRPDAPEDARGGSRRSRDRRFAPRYGFDSVQELAQFGDPLNLVYANQGNLFAENKNGGVRVNTSLLWSAVYSVGSAQYLQMMAAVGASDIYSIDYERTAFGSNLIKLFTKNSAWIYSKNGGSAWIYSKNGGRLVYTDKKLGTDADPSRLLTPASRSIYDPVLDFNARSEGFSQAFSPSSASEFGITSPVPIFVRVYARNDKGVPKKTEVGISVLDAGRAVWWPDFYRGDPNSARPLIQVGQQIVVKIKIVKEQRKNSDVADDFADEIRSAAAESVELGALYKLGSAKFQLVQINGDTQLDKDNTQLVLECVESGCAPFEDYETEDVLEREEELERDRDTLREEILRLTEQRNSISLSSYVRFGGEWTAKKFALLEKVRVKRDQMEDLYDAVVSYKREPNQMDELILEAENSIPGEQFVPQQLRLASRITAIEDNIENDRDTKERISANIERLGSTKEREKRLQDVKNIIAARRVNLRKLRKKLKISIREHAVANGVIATQMAAARRLRQDIKQEFRDLLGAQPEGLAVYNEIWNQLPDSLIDITTDNPRASRERQALRKFKNVLAKLENLLLGLADVDYAAYNLARADLNTQIFNKQQALNAIIRQLNNPNSFNDYLGVKCLTRLHEADYETLSPINLVHFSLKAKVFMRVSGRAPQYAETKAERYKDSDNGNKSRVAMFRVKCKRPYESETDWKSPDVIFCIRKTYEKDFYLPLMFRSGKQEKWQFKFDPVIDAPAEAKKAGTALSFMYLEGRGPVVPAGTENNEWSFYCRGYSRKPGINNRPPKNHSPYGIDEWTLFSTHADTALQFSFDQGPEFRIATVTEQQFEPAANYPELYKHMTTLGVNIYSSAGLTNVRNLSVFVSKGKNVRRINIGTRTCPSNPDGPSSYAPDIFLDTVLDPINGIKEYVGIDTVPDPVNSIKEYVDIKGIDIDSDKGLAFAKQFCLKNNYHMDGVLADRTAWRSFWTEVAPYSLLELARIGGKETLIPAVPTLPDGTITRDVQISALFNQGNIIEDSYKEDFIDYGEATQDVIVTVVYRDQPPTQAFPKNTSVTVKLKDANEALCSRRTFDLSSWVTNRHQAIDYAKLLCAQRRYSHRAVEFKTFPVEAPVQPGAYIYVHMEENQWNDVHSGVVLSDGTLNIPFSSESINGTFATLIYRQGQQPFKTSVTYSNGQSSQLSAYPNCLFVLGAEVSGKRVFRVTEVAMEEEGEVRIKAVEHRCEEKDGKAKSFIADFSTGLYDIS
jgi:hypothetical protein